MENSRNKFVNQIAQLAWFPEMRQVENKEAWRTLMPHLQNGHDVRTAKEKKKDNMP